ncbi:predicted protein [Uncinocarpus reesii 1704]|uniref:Methyltransferase domain-containing protein n=1 Tax=Uncinocarpus reesii (strain UAMH 1704) TaxID=336963 RepID=C4JPK2_UNCRE|nr:uncharacterized protein UREG_03174 [Uncinocarpus reesii 1704]EEP78328.1 predicted protein [Uncinocarpus reesii 1704]
MEPAVDAETLFDYLGKRYEDAYVNSPQLEAVVQDVLKQLKPGSRILDIGCGTGKPVAAMLAAAGHSVHGIDVSEEMLKIARAQVPGTFEKMDMRKFVPSYKFDAIFAIYSLFQISPSETHAMASRFAEWLQGDGGILVLGVGVTPSTSLNKVLIEDKIWNSVRWVGKPWMTKTTDETLMSRQGWRDLLRGTGLVIEAETSYTFHPDDSEHKVPEDTYLLVAKRLPLVCPFLGPYPHPEVHSKSRTRNASAWKEFQSRFAFEAGQEAILDPLKDGTKILDIGDGLGCILKEAVDIVSKATKAPLHTLGNLPFADRSFDTAFALLTLDYADDLEKTLQEIARVTDITNPNSRIIVVQSAPESESQKLMSAICTPLSAQDEARHQGYILHTGALDVLPKMGFGDVCARRVRSNLHFREEEIPRQYDRAAELFAGLWYREDPNFEQMKEALMPQLKLMFKDHPNIIRSELVVLLARPTQK